MRRQAGVIHLVLNTFSVHLICSYRTTASLLTCKVPQRVNIITADQSDKPPCNRHQAVDKHLN